MRFLCSRHAVRTFVPFLLVLSLMTSWGSVARSQITSDPCEAGPTLYREAKFEEARIALRQCLDSNGPDVKVLLPLVVMGVQQDRLQEALEYGAAAVELAPDDAEARYWYGRALLRAKQPDEAKAQWEAGLQQSVDHLGILEGLSRLAMAQGEPAKAYQLLSQMQRLGMNQPWLHRLMADIAAGKGLWAQSLGHLQDSMVLEGGGTPEDLLTAAELSIMAGDKSGAVEFCRRAVILEPGAPAFGGLGQAYFALDQMDSAMVYLRLAVMHDPEDQRFRFNLANALEVTGQFEEADFHFQTYLKMAPEDPVGHFNYAIHLEKMGRTAEALLSVNQAIALDPNMLTARVVRTQMLESLGHWDEALAELDDLQKLDKVNAAQLATWQARLISEQAAARGQSKAGLVHLQHMVVGRADVVELIQAGIAAGTDFAALVVRFSSGPAAARGGDIGWVNPSDMVSPLREGIEALGINEISPPIESKGLYHIFKRIP